MVSLRRPATLTVAGSLMILMFAAACVSLPVSPSNTATGQNNGSEQPDANAEAASLEAAFDPETVPEELRQETFNDIKSLIEKLNDIIRRRDYNAWIECLTEEYLVHYSDPVILAEISQEPVLRRYGITLRTLQDYFNNVVFPSRQNMRIDDIEFMGPDRVEAITVNAKEERLVLYNLEKIGDTWKIGIWR